MRDVILLSRSHTGFLRRCDLACRDHGPIAIKNPNDTQFTDSDGKELPFHHGVYKYDDGTLLPRFVVMGICAASDGTVYLTTLAPFTLHSIRLDEQK